MQLKSLEAMAFVDLRRPPADVPDADVVLHSEAHEDDQVLRTIMRGYQDGNAHDFQRLYEKTLPMIRGYVYSVVHDRSHACDLVQEVYLQLHRSRHTYNAAFPVRPWVIGIARHVWLMHQRHRARRSSREVVGIDMDVDVAVPPEMERLGEKETLARALSLVRRDQRECLVLHHVYGLTFREIAGISGISEGAARTRASRGMAELRIALAPQPATR